MKKRKMSFTRLRPECVEDYMEYHRTIWPELVAAYRRAGIAHISCFLKGLILVIYAEYEEWSDGTLHPEDREIDDRWQALMRPMADPQFEGGELEEIFNMSSIPLDA